MAGPWVVELAATMVHGKVDWLAVWMADRMAV